MSSSSSSLPQIKKSSTRKSEQAVDADEAPQKKPRTIPLSGIRNDLSSVPLEKREEVKEFINKLINQGDTTTDNEPSKAASEPTTPTVPREELEESLMKAIEEHKAAQKTVTELQHSLSKKMIELNKIMIRTKDIETELEKPAEYAEAHSALEDQIHDNILEQKSLTDQITQAEEEETRTKVTVQDRQDELQRAYPTQTKQEAKKKKVEFIDGDDNASVNTHSTGSSKFSDSSLINEQNKQWEQEQTELAKRWIKSTSVAFAPPFYPPNDRSYINFLQNHMDQEKRADKYNAPRVEVIDSAIRVEYRRLENVSINTPGYRPTPRMNASNNLPQPFGLQGQIQGLAVI